MSWVKYDASQYGFYLLGGVGASNEEPVHCTQGIGWSNLWFSCYHYYLDCLAYCIAFSVFYLRTPEAAVRKLKNHKNKWYGSKATLCKDNC